MPLAKMGLSWEGCLTSELIGSAGQLLRQGCAPCPDTRSSCPPSMSPPLQSLQKQEQTVLTYGKGYLLIWLSKLVQQGVRQEAVPQREWKHTDLMPNCTVRQILNGSEIDMNLWLPSLRRTKSVQLAESCVLLLTKKVAKSLNWHKYIILGFAFFDFYSRKYVNRTQTQHTLYNPYTDSI